MADGPQLEDGFEQLFVRDGLENGRFSPATAAWLAVSGAAGLDRRLVQQLVASAARELARELPIDDHAYDADLDGPVKSPENIKTAAIEARHLLQLVANLLGGSADLESHDLAFAGTLKKRSGWKPSAKQTQAQSKRRAAANRVYELMAEQYFDIDGRPKQEAAIADVMKEFGLARSKIMLGLREHRQRLSVWSQINDPRESMGWADLNFKYFAMEKERLKRNGP